MPGLEFFFIIEAESLHLVQRRCGSRVSGMLFPEHAFPIARRLKWVKAGVFESLMQAAGRFAEDTWVSPLRMLH
jgi:hypothetical protein